MSRRTAELALLALSSVWRRAAPRRNGCPVPPEWRAAFVELHQVIADARDEPGSVSGTKLAHSVGEARGSGAMVSTAAAAAADSVPLTVERVASLVGVTPRAVRKAINDGRLRATRTGRVWLLEASEVERFRRERQVA